MKNLLILLISTLAFYSCEKELESIQLDKSEITIHYDENYQLNVSYSPTDVDIPPVFTWYAEDTKVAEVDQNGFVEGVKIGETDINVQTEDGKFQALCKVIIEPISNLYIEPVIEFGKSKSYVENIETRLIYGETTDALVYEGDNYKVKYVMYIFEFNRLTSSAVLLIDNAMEEVGTFLSERHDYIGSEDGMLAFRVNANVVAVLTDHYELGLVVLYMENSDMKSTSSIYELFDIRLNELRKQNF